KLVIYSGYDIMLVFRLDKEAQNDLEELALTDPLVVTRFRAFLEQAKCDPNLLRSLSTHSFDDSDIDIKKWIRRHNEGQPIWRLRFCCFVGREPDYRVFYCIDRNPKQNIVYILGIKRRKEIDYDDEDHPTSRRIISAFSRCCARIHM